MKAIKWTKHRPPEGLAYNEAGQTILAFAIKHIWLNDT
jgi:hypothetical protein